ncbi:MAG: hypothetical protein PHW65_03410 [Dehalococcoidales bacterium]|nr:hypothetical protein [Dehalococcoidales bacterium]
MAVESNGENSLKRIFEETWGSPKQTNVNFPARAKTLEQFENLSPGSHLSLFYESHSEWLAGVASFIYLALKHNQK